MVSRISHILLFFWIFSCQSPGYFQSQEVIKTEDELQERLIKDIIVSLQHNFPPAKTRFIFQHQGKKLGLALDQALRKLGYGIEEKPADVNKTAQVPRLGVVKLKLAYILSPLDSHELGLVQLRLVVGEEFEISRLYRKKDGSYSAAGPLLLRKG